MDASETKKHDPAKVAKKIVELNKRLAKINSKIQRMEEADVPSDTEEEEQAVKLEHQLKRKAVQIYKQLKKYHGENAKLLRSKEKTIQIDVSF